jgi:hypothetical protein
VGARLASALIFAAVAGCTVNGDESSAPATPTSRVERCTDRLVARADLEDASDPERQATRRYARLTYCAPFEREGWIYDDGALRIDAYLHVRRGGACVQEPPRAVRCGNVVDDGPILDCALLHHVRRSEVRSYLAHDPAEREKRCDDGTPLDELGVPGSA